MNVRTARVLVVFGALVAIGGLLVLPLSVVFIEALRPGLAAAAAALTEPEALSALRLTLLVAAISVLVNTVCGFIGAWCIARFDFPGRTLLVTVIELPLAVSPVISGLVWVLLFGARGWFGPMLEHAGVQIVFAVPGLILATLFVTFPLVVRALLPLMREQGRQDEEAAITLGAPAWQMFLHVTLPNVRWALLQGVLLCNARAMGEFGAVSVVSGHIRGETMTMPLHIEALYNDFRIPAAFAVAALLAALALLTLAAKSVLEWHTSRASA